MKYVLEKDDVTVIVDSLTGYDDWTVIHQQNVTGPAPYDWRDGEIISIDYINQRRAAYPPIEDQLDMIFHDIDGWRAIISAIKAQYPKP